MPVHDWTRVDAGVFHAFHHRWIAGISDVLNTGLLPNEYYALSEQDIGPFGADVLTLRETNGAAGHRAESKHVSGNGGPGLLLAAPKVELTGETDLEFYRQKQDRIAVRHVSGDDIIAVIEIMSWGNKSSVKAFQTFVDKAESLLAQQVHLLVVDLYPTTARDPRGIHGAIWEDIAGQDYELPADKPLTLASYDAGPGLRAYVVQLSVGEPLTDMPLFLRPGAHIVVPLEATYQAAFSVFPRRYRQELEF